MGCANAKPVIDGGNLEEDITPKTLWRQPLSLEETRRKYFLGQSNSPTAAAASLVEFRALLDDPVAIKYFYDFAKTRNNYKLIRCWKDIQAKKFLKNIDMAGDPLGGSSAMLSALPDTVYQLIIKEYAPAAVRMNSVSGTGRTDKEEAVYVKHLEQAQGCAKYSDIPSNILEELCFKSLHHHIYLDFINTDYFNDMCNQLRESYNLVHENDFEYFDKISEGAYGLVVHVKKKSTGKHYAMKIQHKAMLLRHYKDDTKRMLQEMQSIACCNHPFIIGLAYAFQTPILAMMTLPLAVYGDLGVLIMNSPCKRIPLPHVQFYVAEIVSALVYLHSNGLIYRDLKPANVLLNGDGHVLLADFGAIADVEGIISSCTTSKITTYTNTNKTQDPSIGSKESENVQVSTPLPLFRVYQSIEQTQEQKQIHEQKQQEQAFPNPNPIVGESAERTSTVIDNENEEDSLPGEPLRDRAKSIVGTVAYMAPEILFKFGSGEFSDITYTKAVDYWSLGVTTYAMIYGRLPFRQVKLDKLQEQLANGLSKSHANYYQVFRQIFGRITYAGIDNFGGYSYDSNASDYCSTETLTQMQENEAVISSFVNNLVEFNPLVRGTGASIIKEDEEKQEEKPEPSASKAAESDEEGSRRVGGSDVASDSIAGSALNKGINFPSQNGIKGHQFFKNIDWGLLESKLIVPPPLPTQVITAMNAKYSGKGLHVTGEFAPSNKSGDNSSFQSGTTSDVVSTGVAPTPAIAVPTMKPKAGVELGKSTLEEVLVKNNRKAWLRTSEKKKVIPKPVEEAKKSTLSACLPWKSKAAAVSERGVALAPPTNSHNQPRDSDASKNYRIRPEEQQYFSNWYFVSPLVVDEEYNAQRLSIHKLARNRG